MREEEDMWLCTVYKANAHDNPSKKVIRVHGIGSVENLMLEMNVLHTFSFDDPDLLALVQGEQGEEEARDIARYFADRLHLAVEF